MTSSSSHHPGNRGRQILRLLFDLPEGLPRPKASQADVAAQVSSVTDPGGSHSPQRPADEAARLN